MTTNISELSELLKRQNDIIISLENNMLHVLKELAKHDKTQALILGAIYLSKEKYDELS